MDTFYFTKTSANDPVIEIRKRGGVLIKTSDWDYLWVIAPFWDDSVPMEINVPNDRQISAVIVINTKVEGCLPLNSFFAADENLPKDEVYVLSPENPHDWHKLNENHPEIDKQIQVKPLPEKATVGKLDITYTPNTDFVHISWVDETYQKINILIGLNLFYNSQPEKPIRKKSFYFIGNFGNNLAETLPAIHEDIFNLEGVHLYMMKDWIYAHSPDVIEMLKMVGNVHTFGEGEE